MWRYKCGDPPIAMAPCAVLTSVTPSAADSARPLLYDPGTTITHETTVRSSSHDPTEPPAAVQLPPRPSIVFTMIDDLGWRGVPWHGNAEAKTPTLDALRRSGVTLGPCHSAAGRSSRGSAPTFETPEVLSPIHPKLRRLLAPCRKPY